MKMMLAAVGKLKDRGLEALVADYVGRVSKRIPLKIIEVKNSGKLLASVPKGYKKVVLDERGELLNTKELASFLEKLMLNAVPGVAWIIGGSNGLDDTIKRRADKVLSLSPMTFPHRLARLILCEQLYRALTIIHGEPYHK